MQLSKQSLDIAKNFANINSNFLIVPGKIQKTISGSKDIMAEIEFLEDFPKEAGIYNMNEFLGVVSLFEKPEFDFDDKFVTISEGKNTIKYVYSDASLLTVPPAKQFVMPTPEVVLDMSVEHLQKMQKASSALSVYDVALIGNGDRVTAKIFDVRNPTSNSFDLDLGTETSDTFEVYFKLDKLAKLYPGSYNLSISSKKISKFVHKDIKLTVYVAVESNSKF
jgi:hypothetical protein